MKNAVLPLVFFAMLGGNSCKKVIQVNLNDAAPQIVIEGEITNAPGPYHIKISQSVNFSATNTFPPVTGAIVRITDSTTGLDVALNETDSGVYTTPDAIEGIPEDTYKLSVIVDGKQYTASSTMPRQVNLDSISFEENIGFNNKEDIDAVVNFQDPAGLGNYYQFIESVNGRTIPNIFVFEDRLSDGKYIRQPLFNDSSYLQKNDTLTLAMYCVDENTYNYFNTLSEVTGNNSFQSATPANPNTNISNGALGYFSAHTATSQQKIVH
jgi:hypothetical protein